MQDLRNVVETQNRLRDETITDPSATWQKWRLFTMKIDKFIASLNNRIGYVGGLLPSPLLKGNEIQNS